MRWLTSNKVKGDNRKWVDVKQSTVRNVASELRLLKIRKLEELKGIGISAIIATAITQVSPFTTYRLAGGVEKWKYTLSKLKALIIDLSSTCAQSVATFICILNTERQRHALMVGDSSMFVMLRGTANEVP